MVCEQSCKMLQHSEHIIKKVYNRSPIPCNIFWEIGRNICDKREIVYETMQKHIDKMSKTCLYNTPRIYNMHMHITKNIRHANELKPSTQQQQQQQQQQK
jgi:hypothetical protein